jgi:protein arginine N-methyltransferase 1
MRDDVVRTEAYRRALQNVVHDKTIVDIGTGALALLAIFAAEAGARKVYAIEANAEAYVKALQAYPYSLLAGFS